MWEKLRSLTLGDSGRESLEEGAVTPERAPEPPSTVTPESKEPPTCHFLRLPTEIRLQIYAYTDIGGHTIEVLSLPIVQTSQGTQYFRTYSTNPIDHELIYRIESKHDEQYRERTQTTPTRSSGYSGPAVCVMPSGRRRRTSPSEPPSSSGLVKRKRCFSVHGLFSLPSVCRQTRADIQLLVYELNTFAFTDTNYNYSRAIRAFIQSLTEPEISAIRTIYWPLVNALLYRRCSLHGFLKIEEPDQSCVEELRAFKGLKRLVLRYYGSQFSSIADKRSEAEELEFKALLAEKGGWDYAVDREFQRTLAVRSIKALIEREQVDVECERTWRANF